MELISEVTGHPVVGEFIVLRGALGGSVLWNVGYSGEEGWDAFKEAYEIDPEDYLGNPAEDHYQGTLFTRLIRRRSDGKVFGAHYWFNPGIDSIEGQDGDVDLKALGVVWDWEHDEPEPTVFLPVRKFLRVGYEVVKVSSD